ncbi:hypothetical protein PVK22_11125 [Klebsiella oxytoca]|uniref:hypothetical protein n=1 Tax=Klebsiella oxytoca TaxID=571 RepID=UPI0023DAD2E4|nr:hypothetical protein [Klebsiella oxytoca]EGT0049180.1 hypothetical protein [Klebsiella oxytoca]WDQ03458.1 hypothetical protein PVK22_15525 [Klebsiella oxytoca]WDQ06678.1 hypothetical protein PVK22_04290 [Klebsiella oxytoca]WDQ07918.1 hypothetical protein PVK22_11125 [Klebsiella oxytoca]
MLNVILRLFRRQDIWERRLQTAIDSEIEKIHQRSSKRMQLTAKIASLPYDVLVQHSTIAPKKENNP